MQLKKLIDNRSDRLTLIFAGWGMDSRPFGGLTHRGADLAVVWDYRSLEPTELSTLIASYSEVNVIAWSFGVYAASRVLSRHEDRISRRVAVNGTLRPVDDSYGIPKDIFEGTLRGMNERNLRKFYRRMCASAEEFARFTGRMPERDVEELTEELACFGRYAEETPETDFRWDFALTSDADAIIPAENQRRAWALKDCGRADISGGHLPDFQSIADRYIIDKPLMAERFARAIPTYEEEGYVQRRIAGTLFEKALPHIRGMKAERIFEAGYGTGMLTRLYAPVLSGAEAELYDLVNYEGELPECATTHTADAEAAIAEAAPESFDVIFSASAMQWFSSPEAFIRNAARALRKGGTAAISTFAPENLHELTDITGSGLAVPSAENLRRMAREAGFKEIYIEQEEIAADFPELKQMLEHLKLTGVTGVSHSSRRKALRLIMERYPRRADGSIRLVYRPIYMILKV